MVSFSISEFSCDTVRTNNLQKGLKGNKEGFVRVGPGVLRENSEHVK